MAVPSKASLSQARRRLVELMQQINFGRIEGLLVRRGEPVLNDPAPKVFFEVKFGADNGPRPEAVTGDFALKQQVIDLLAHLDRLQEAQIQVLTIKDGLPFGMHVEAQR